MPIFRPSMKLAHFFLSITSDAPTIPLSQYKFWTSQLRYDDTIILQLDKNCRKFLTVVHSAPLPKITSIIFSPPRGKVGAEFPMARHEMRFILRPLKIEEEA